MPAPKSTSKASPSAPVSRRSSRLSTPNAPTTEPSTRSATTNFKGVYVALRPRTPHKAASTTSSVASNSPIDTFTRENSANPESPLTDATSISDSLTGSGFATSAKVAMSGSFSSKAKRPRQTVDLVPDSDATDNDVELALALQEEEYNTSGSKRGKVSSARGTSTFPISISNTNSSATTSDADDNDDDDDDDDDDNEDEDDDDSSVQIVSTRKRQSPRRQATARSATAGSSRLRESIVVPETDSDSGLSDAILVESSFEEDSDEEADEDEDEDGDGATSAARRGRSGANAGGSNNDSATADGMSNWERRRRNRNNTRATRERARLESTHPEIITMWDDLRALPKIVLEQRPQPSSISRKMKGFQLEGLDWLIKQEKTSWKGGLLGDEMGMGKTIQAVSLIMSDYPVKDPTLVVVPPVALMQWTNEISDYTDGKLRVLIYHGTNTKAKNMSVKELKTYDVIMISYSGLESIYRKEVKGWSRGEKLVKEDSAIHAIKFHRIILDEAHSIKARNTGVAKACFALKGTYRWALSGTPVQNRIGEFFSLLRFLGIQPYANYFCKQCSCTAVHWSSTADYRCSHCRHRNLDHVSVFNQEILNPITTGETEAERKEGLAKLRLLTDHIMLRRLKKDQTASMELPAKEIIVHNEFFGEIERDFSSSVMTNTARQFDTYVSRGVMLNNYANIFGLIMQMRQVADHPDLLLKKHADPDQNILVCNICDDPAEDAVRSKCKHDFCRACVKDFIRTCEASDATAHCPRCHIQLTIDIDQVEIEQNEEIVKKSSIINRIKMENWTSSTKIEMLVYDLYKLRSKKQTLKSIVFSQFTSMLQLIEWRLRRAGFNTVMLDGSMNPAQRQKSIEYFMTNTDVEVFLVSLKAGGVALNLTEASRVFIVDPWWNPAAEWQSADRCHRIGQKRPCVITRLCIEDSVESRIVMLQEKKANLIHGTVNGDDVAMDKLSPEDMQFLFRGS